MVDRYTKIVLTAIAVALGALALQGFVRPAVSQLSSSGCGSYHDPCHVKFPDALNVRIQ